MVNIKKTQKLKMSTKDSCVNSESNNETPSPAYNAVPPLGSCTATDYRPFREIWPLFV